MLKQIKFAAFALLFAAGLAACSDDDNTTGGGESAARRTEAYVVNQGNMYSNIPGSISGLDLVYHNVASNVFWEANNQKVGDTPQAAVHYGSKIYIPVFGSNLVWVVDASTMKVVGEISVKSPEAVCGAAGYVFVASNEGYVVRADTTEYAGADQQLAVGPNPAGMTAVGGTVYVTISDGYNYMNADASLNYANGKKVVAVNAEQFAVEKEIAVGLNPTQIAANSAGELFVLANGNYADVAPVIQKVATDGTVTDLFAGSMMTLVNNVLYTLNVTYSYAEVDGTWVSTPSVSSKWYDTVSGAQGEDFLPADRKPVNPVAINVNPADGHVFICTRPTTGSDAYTSPGYVYEYTGKDAGFAFVYAYNVGIEPYGVVFK